MSYRWRYKAVCWLLLAFQGFFLNVIVPGHTRGVISLAGRSSACSLADLGCPLCGPSSAGKKSAPAHPDSSGCAICHLAVRISIEAMPDLRLGELGLLFVSSPPRDAIVASLQNPSLPWSRGPPLLDAQV